MKDSKEKEHRISNLKDMINTMKDKTEESSKTEDNIGTEIVEEDEELIKFLNHEEEKDFDDLKIDDEFIYYPSQDDEYATNLEEENPIDETYIIKTKNVEEDTSEELNENYEEIEDKFSDELSENLDNILNTKIGKTPIYGIVSLILGIIFLVVSVIVFNSGTERIVDNVVSGETHFITVIILTIGLLLIIFGIYKVFNFKNPIDGLMTNIESIDKKQDKEDNNKTPKPKEKTIPKSKIPLDKNSYKVGEFNMDELKSKLKKNTHSKKEPIPENIDEIPIAKEKPKNKKGLTSDEIEEEHQESVPENESIDDIFAGVEEIDDIPIISIDSKEKKSDE